ncbi:hypothetical protein [Streptomyces chartreusis]|uniref:hypothetical protein n=1 Tax=Streptomyces chartreusis TaxID=1969 RepID=UPI002E819635|nr:hypothetical protein [Streptomyces chartreusis]WUB23842.1 hypothetical protein OG997_44770 [Streptomyces chartreusis]
MPSILIIDTPRKALGSNPDDQERGWRIYRRFKALTDAYGSRLQLIIADNDTAPLPDDAFSTIKLDYYTRPMVPGVAHPGPGHTTRTHRRRIPGVAAFYIEPAVPAEPGEGGETAERIR